MGLVVARFQYALPAIAGQILVNDLQRIYAVFAKSSRWQLTAIVPSAADIVDNADKKLFLSALNPAHCLHDMIPPKKCSWEMSTLQRTWSPTTHGKNRTL